jgi:hydrogenase expression/formation protein HypD
LGNIPGSGYKLSKAYKQFDAEEQFDVASVRTSESPICISGEILKGLKKPYDCPAFCRDCTPETPLGATMVSSEGTCATYYKFRKLNDGVEVYV